MMYAAIDFGISNTDAVAYLDGEWQRWTRPSEGRPDPGLVRTILAAGGVDLASLQRLAVTGGQHKLLPERIDGCPLVAVNEVTAIGRGGQALAGLSVEDNASLLVVSAGSGTAVVAAQGDRYAHVTGTAVGGGTLLGLSRLLLHTVDHDEIDALARQGNPNGADLSLGDVIIGPIGNLPADATASNFGRLAREDVAVSREDLAAALVTMVGQTIALIAINAARTQAAKCGLDTVRAVVIGHLIDMLSMRSVVEQVEELYGVPIVLPVDSGYGTALGALLHTADAPLSYASVEGAKR
jgi:type II pantothenate kinase